MNSITKTDLDNFADKIISEFKKILDSNGNGEQASSFDWMRSKEVRRLMGISPATLQNLRVAGKLRHRKIMGSYYYSRIDLQNLFENE